MLRFGLCLAVVSLLASAACVPATPISATALPAGDATRGAVLFTQSINGAPICANCHSLDGSPLSGPSMKGYAARAGTRIANTSAADYTYASIIKPSAYLVDGFGNEMYSQYADRLSSQQIADLIAYLLSQ